MALFGKTALQWRQENPATKGNIRDMASVEQLVVEYGERECCYDTTRIITKSAINRTEQNGNHTN